LKKTAALLFHFLLISCVFFGCQESDLKQENAPSKTTMKEIITKEKSKVPANNFVLPTTDGKMVKLSDFKGKKVVINFWTTWCPPCKEELPELQRFYEQADSEHVAFLGINITSEEGGKEEVKSFLSKSGFDFPVLFDEKGEVMKLYKVMVIPTTFIIDEQGQVFKKIIGPVTTEQLKRLTDL